MPFSIYGLKLKNHINFSFDLYLYLKHLKLFYLRHMFSDSCSLWLWDVSYWCA